MKLRTHGAVDVRRLELAGRPQIEKKHVDALPTVSGPCRRGEYVDQVADLVCENLAGATTPPLLELGGLVIELKVFHVVSRQLLLAATEDPEMHMCRLDTQSSTSKTRRRPDLSRALAGSTLRAA